MKPKKWHIYIVDLEPRIKSKPGKQKPCISIQPSEFNEFGHPSTLIIPLTTRVSEKDNFPLRVKIPKGTCGLTSESEAVIDQMLAWDNTFFRQELGELAEELKEKIKAAVLDFLDL